MIFLILGAVVPVWFVLHVTTNKISKTIKSVQQKRDAKFKAELLDYLLNINY